MAAGYLGGSIGLVQIILRCFILSTFIPFCEFGGSFKISLGREALSKKQSVTRGCGGERQLAFPGSQQGCRGMRSAYLVLLGR